MKLFKLTPLVLAMTLTGCGTIGNQVREFDDPQATRPVLKKAESLKPPAQGAIAVAVYNFRDMTGQRKASQTIAQLSSAVTQGADAYLVKSLQEVGNGQWFKVLERGGLDNLVKERQLIRQMRELYQGKDAQPLPPMMFAGMILEGGIVGYDSNTMSGGSGARILGIGAQTEYRQDEVTISLRAVSVATGEVLTAVTISKTVLSFQDKLGILRFYDAGTKAFEAETGSATNESMNKAVQLAIHAAVVEMINEGAKKGHWGFRAEPKSVVAPAPEVKPEVKQESKPQEKPAVQEPKAEPAKVKPEVKQESKPEVSVTPTVEPVVIVKTGKVVEWVNMREKQDLSSDKVLKLKPDTLVEIEKSDGNFYFVKFDGKVGWVTKRFIKVQ